MERQAEAYFEKIDHLGGVIPAIETGFFQREIANAAFLYQQDLERHERVVVGVNDFEGGNEEAEMEILRIDPAHEAAQVERLQRVRAKRDGAAVARALDSLGRAAQGSDNLMPYILDAVRVYATEGEVMSRLVEVWGIYVEEAVI
jgi:methylmalonyl-CoA mutase N-terminal domain/subunit